MTKARTQRTVLAALVLGGTALSMPVAYAADSPEIAALRAATQKYTDPKVAVADGYVATDECVVDPNGKGAMGFHYVNMKLFEAGPEANKPAALVYQPDGKGGRKLVAVEWFKVDADQNLATSDDKPSLFGKPFDGPMEGHSPGMPKHYDLHAWIYQDNPDGMFAQYNPKGTCEGAEPAAAPGAPAEGQVHTMPAGAPATGMGSTAGTEFSWLLVAGAAATAAGAVAGGFGLRAATRRI
jgi:hypothetical protein